MLTLFTFISCEEMLKEEPRSFLSPDAIESVADAENVMAGVLSRYINSSYYGRKMYIMVGGSTDQMYVVSGSSKRQEMDHFSYTGENDIVKSVWKYGFSIIANSNNMIAGVKNSGTMNETQIKNYVSAARFLRAHAYFDLLRLYGGLPLLKEPVTSADQVINAERTSTVDLLNFLVTELSEIENDFSDEWNSSQLGKGKPTAWSAKALLANVYLTLAGNQYNQTDKWALAAAKAKEVIDNGSFDLRENYDELWRVENKADNEYIWSLQTHRSMWAVISRPGGGNMGKQAGWGTISAENGFMELFDDADERKAATFLTEIDKINSSGESEGIITYTEWQEGVPFIAKWAAPRNTGVDPSKWNEESKRKATNMPIFRLSEMYLIHAEASNEAAGPSDDAYTSLNKVRTRAGLTALSSLNKETFRDAVRKERTFEFGFELKRRFDLIRWGTFYDVMKNDPQAKDNIQPHHTLYPIPQNDYDLLLGFDQNEGYPDSRTGDDE